MALQKAIEYFDREYLTNRFCVTHFGGCSILFNKDTSRSDIEVSSVYFHDTREGQQQDICFFGRHATTMSLHLNNPFVKKRGVGKKLLLPVRTVMLEEHVDFLAGTSTVPLCAAHAATIEDSPVFLNSSHCGLSIGMSSGPLSFVLTVLVAGLFVTKLHWTFIAPCQLQAALPVFGSCCTSFSAFQCAAWQVAKRLQLLDTTNSVSRHITTTYA